MFGLKSLVNKRKRKILEEYLANLDPTDSNMKYVASIVLTKHGEPVIIHYSEIYTDGLVTVTLICVMDSSCVEVPMHLVFSGAKMVIGDIQVLHKRTRSRGYGRLLMETALSLAAKSDIKEVTGIMAGSEPGQRERQISYYTRFGFTIDGNNLYLKLSPQFSYMKEG